MTLDAAAHYQKHCPGCFQLKGGVAVCPHCGYDEGGHRSPLFLPHGTILGNHYRVGRVLGRPGGFGITYLGWDVNLQQRVAIKEYLPREIAQRMPNSLEVDVHTADDKRGFEFGKEQFLREARIVAKLDHANIVRVRNFFNANSTAYLVMDYYEGMSLGDYLSSVRNKLEPELAVPLVKPILDGLQYVHERGLVHRDLKPHNIYLAAIGRPIVLDFGAARQAAGDRVQSLSVVLTEGYAPLEQYQRRAVQGPWTDVYGVAATLYRMITGASPPIALDRIGRDPVEDGGWSAMPAGLVPAMRMALAVRPSDRYQSAIEFHAALDRFMSGSQGTSAIDPAQIMPVATPFVPPTEEPLQAPQRTAQPAETAVINEPMRPAIVERQAPVAVAPGVIGPAGGSAAGTARAMPPRQPPSAESPQTRPVPPPPDALRLPPLIPPPATGRAGALGVFATEPPRPQPTHLVSGAKLHHRASEVATPPPPMTSASGPRWLPLMLLVIGVLVIGYVLLNPPQGKATAKLVIKPATAVQAVAAPVEAVAAAVPVRIPALIPLPAGSVVLRDSSADAAANASLTARVAPVHMGRTEVTVAEFRDFVQRTGYENPRWQNYPCESAGGRLPDWQDPGYSQSDESPVVCVSWADANAYTQWLTRETGTRFRLPTEAEWEYAARAGTETRFWWGNDADNGMAVCQSCPPKLPTQPAIAASTPPNPFGLYETLGNVREWTCSAYESYAANAAGQCGVLGEGARVAVRGGSWQQPVDTLVASYREAYEPYRRNVWTGFRVVQDERAMLPEAKP